MQVKDDLHIDDIQHTIVRKVNNFLPADWRKNNDPFTRTSYIKKNFPSWQYNGSGKWNDILIWCEQTFGDNWVWNWETIYFKHDKDRTIFLMRWAG